MSQADHDLIKIVEQFVYHEAALLDEEKWDEWQNLFTSDGTYWMPLDPVQPDPLNHVSLIYDNRTLLDLRCRRLRDADDMSSLSLQPFPKVLRYLSNITAHSSNGQIQARANLLAAQHAGGMTQQLHGRVRWTLSGSSSDLRVYQKRVDLLSACSPLRDILVYL